MLDFKLHTPIGVGDLLCLLYTSITLLRKETSAVLQERITSQLHDLEMKSAQFEIDITQKGTFNNKGWDNVEFLISTNAGEGLKPLAKTASGGEMSRVMPVSYTHLQYFVLS